MDLVTILSVGPGCDSMHPIVYSSFLRHMAIRSVMFSIGIACVVSVVSGSSGVGRLCAELPSHLLRTSLMLRRRGLGGGGCVGVSV